MACRMSGKGAVCVFLFFFFFVFFPTPKVLLIRGQIVAPGSGGGIGWHDVTCSLGTGNMACGLWRHEACVASEGALGRVAAGVCRLCSTSIYLFVSFWKQIEQNSIACSTSSEGSDQGRFCCCGQCVDPGRGSSGQSVEFPKRGCPGPRRTAGFF
jgi:hypothetical protein